MRKLNSIERSQYIEERYKEYLRSSFAFDRKDLQKLFEEQLEKEILFKGPYVDMSFPFERGHSIEYLMETGVICRYFSKLNDIDFKRPLYAHQEEVIKLVNSGRSVIVTTGTGSGKTECFLYPILNELLRDLEQGNNGVGVRAIFLYPMNALVNDQIDRIRKILKNCPEITFGFFTGETPEKISDSKRREIAQDNDTEISSNEMVSREDIRNNPPHLLFTNYSMLEHLLITPNDYSIFEPERLKNWKYVILDEAHTYSGSLGIEISLLLRRLTGLAQKKPRFILTSATLGKQGKSEIDILRFATNLTSVEFRQSDIVFSKRIPLPNGSEYRILGEDYISMKNVITKPVQLRALADKYIADKHVLEGVMSSKVILFELLSKDENVHYLSRLLEYSSKDFKLLCREMSGYLEPKELICLIDLINATEKEGIGLFDLKYHSFVRPLSGAYITYGKNPKLSLIKTNEIDGMKAFEVGNCRYCNSPYIIGKIQTKEDQMDYLLQNKEIDIYENYGNEKFVQLDFFLLEDSVNEEEVNKDAIEAFEVCSKCGEIHIARNLNAKKCKCGEQYRFRVYRVLQDKNKDEESIYNNIVQCPCCGHKGKSGVVKALNIGKDEGTALIAQILYEAIGEGDVEEQKVKKLSLKLPSIMSMHSHGNKMKQFLTFSDSRQQASFAAVFFESNHVRMLRKRLIWEMIVQNNYKEMSVNELTACLEDRISTGDLFPDYSNSKQNKDSHKNAWATVLVDLLKVDGSYDGEGLGLYYFDLDIRNLISEISDEEILEAFPDCNMNREKLYTFIQVVFGVFKITPAICYVKSTLTPEERKDILEYRRFNNYVILQNPVKGKREESEKKAFNSIKSFLPAKGESNMIVRYTMKVFGIDVEKAKSVLETVFTYFASASEGKESYKFFKKHDRKNAYQIDASKYVVKNYKTSKFYKCNKCGRLTPYNLNNKCVYDKCQGTLSEVNPDEVLKNNYYRQQYKNKTIERIVIKEHTAQLQRKQAKQIQIAFKNKEINILSCSTTFEMGIDIGGLETVFMRNVPPTPANYAQRAGRAGRRKDSAAYILTYCDKGTHDYTYFSEPEKMISGVINPPFFNVLNKKVILRHLMATSLGYFFRKYPKYFANLGEFILGGGIDEFNKYMALRPYELNAYIDKKILPEAVYSEYWNFKWLDKMGGYDEKMAHFVSSILEILQELEVAQNEAKDRMNKGCSNVGNEIDYYQRQIASLKQKNVISSLSKYCVIPQYGFPVDVVDLQIYDDNGVPVNGANNDKYNMSRDLRVAISEYAPDSEVIVDGVKYTSKYITLQKQTEFRKNWFVTCPTCKKVNVFLGKPDNVECKYCGNSIVTDGAEYYIEPINGFKTGQTKMSTRLKPKRSYSGEVSYLGNGRTDEHIVFENTLRVETSSDDELLVMNKSGFYMCPVCGYSDIVRKKIHFPQFLKKHKDYKLHDCKCDKLDYIRLGHRFQTDVARFTIPMLTSTDKIGYSQALSFLYAFLEGISVTLEIERRDIDGLLEMNLRYQSYDILLYDNVPGGAGHVKRLLNKDAIVTSLRAALRKVNKHCCDENTSCYNCLRNYYNQLYHDKLQRKLAIDVIQRILFQIEAIPESHIDDPKIDKKKMKVVLLPGGRNPGNESAQEIWIDLLEDCFNEDEKVLIKSVMDNCLKNIVKPYYNKPVKIEETGEQFVVNLVWDSRKVMLFLSEAYEDYLLAKKTGWDVYCTKEKFDIEDFLMKVGE